MKKVSLLLISMGLSVLLFGFAPQRAWADEAATHYHKAMAYKKANKIDEAMGELHKAISLREDYAAAHYSLGILYRQKKQMEPAIMHLERAVKIDPKAAPAHYSLGIAYQQINKTEEALAEMQRAVELDNKDIQSRAQLGMLLIRKDPKLAIPHLETVVKAKPDDAEYVHQLGLAYRKANRNKEAEQYLLKAAGMKDNSETEFDLGVLYRRQNKHEQAAEHYEKAIKLDAKMAPAYWDLGHTYEQLKRYDEATQSFNMYLKLQGDAKDAHIARLRIQEIKEKQKGRIKK